MEDDSQDATNESGEHESLTSLSEETQGIRPTLSPSEPSVASWWISETWRFMRYLSKKPMSLLR